MDGKLYRVGLKAPWYYYRRAVRPGELLIRIGTLSGFSHNSVIFLKENGSFFDLKLSKCTDLESFGWLGIKPV